MQTLISLSHYKCLRLDPLPASLFGETYVVVAAMRPAPGEFRGEAYVFTQRPKPELFSTSFTFSTAGVPEDLLDPNLFFILEQSKQIAEVHLIDQLQARTNNMGRADLGALSIRLVDQEANPLLSCWLRGLFKSEISRVASQTRCQGLSVYLNAVTTLQSFAFDQ